MPKGGDYAGPMMTFSNPETTRCEVHPEIALSVRGFTPPPDAAASNTMVFYCPRCAGEVACFHCGRPW